MLHCCAEILSVWYHWPSLGCVCLDFLYSWPRKAHAKIVASAWKLVNQKVTASCLLRRSYDIYQYALSPGLCLTEFQEALEPLTLPTGCPTLCLWESSKATWFSWGQCGWWWKNTYYYYFFFEKLCLYNTQEIFVTCFSFCAYFPTQNPFKQWNLSRFIRCSGSVP